MNRSPAYDSSLLTRVNRAHKARFGNLPERCDLWCPASSPTIPQEADTFHQDNTRTRWVLTAHAVRWLYDKEPVDLTA